MRIIPNRDAVGAIGLRARGLRLTAPRQLILEVVRRTDTHPTAAFVYARVRRRLPRVSLGTVYRNLRRLAAEGLLVERTDEKGLRFDANLTRHDHFTCLACHRIYDVPTPARRPAPSPATRSGFEVLEQRTEYFGRCAACRRRGGVIGDTVTTPVARATAHRRMRNGGT